MSKARLSLCLAIAAIGLAVPPVFAQDKPTPAGGANKPVQSSLVVGALQIGSASKLEVAGYDVNITAGSVAYSYFLKNDGTAELAIAAAITLPELRASFDGSEIWALAAADAENPVGLAVTAGDAPATTTAEVHAYALGVDRLAEIKAAHLPLIPFGPETDKALAALAPDAADRLAALGVVSLRNPAQAGAPLTADWSLDVVRNWRQSLPPGKTTSIVVKFVPVLGRYDLSEDDIDDMKDDVCLEPEVVKNLEARLKNNGVWKVTDISLAIDSPSHWIDSPAPTLEVRKPKPDAIVAFCGMDAKSANQPTVLGVAPDNTNELRVVMFEPAAK